MEASLLFPFSSTLTEALILHMADRSDVDIAKYIDRKVLSGQLTRGDESKQLWKVSSNVSVEDRENTQVSFMQQFMSYHVL